MKRILPFLWFLASLLACTVAMAAGGPITPIYNGVLGTDLNGAATNSITNVLHVGTAGITVFYGDGSQLTVPLSSLTQSGAANNQVIGWNGAAWVPVNQSGGGGGGFLPTNTDSTMSVTPITGATNFSAMPALLTASNLTVAASNSVRSAIPSTPGPVGAQPTNKALTDLAAYGTNFWMGTNIASGLITSNLIATVLGAYGTLAGWVTAAVTNGLATQTYANSIGTGATNLANSKLAGSYALSNYTTLWPCTIFVSQNGSDTNRGTNIFAPVATLTNATAIASNLALSIPGLRTPVLIQVGAGYFPLTNSVYLTTNVALHGAGPATVIDGNLYGSSLIINGDNVDVRDLTIGTNQFTGGYYPVKPLTGTNVTFENVTVFGDTDGLYNTAMTKLNQETWLNCVFSTGWDTVALGGNGVASNSTFTFQSCRFIITTGDGGFPLRGCNFGNVRAIVKDCIFCCTNLTDTNNVYCVSIASTGIITMQNNLYYFTNSVTPANAFGIGLVSGTPILNVIGAINPANVNVTAGTVNYDTIQAADFVGTVGASNLTGALPYATLPGSLGLMSTNNIGAATNLNFGQVGAGTVPTARLGTNAAVAVSGSIFTTDGTSSWWAAPTNFFAANSNLLNAAIGGSALTFPTGSPLTNGLATTAIAQFIGTTITNYFQWGAAVLSNIVSGNHPVFDGDGITNLHAGTGNASNSIALVTAATLLAEAGSGASTILSNTGAGLTWAPSGGGSATSLVQATAVGGSGTSPSFAGTVTNAGATNTGNEGIAGTLNVSGATTLGGTLNTGGNKAGGNGSGWTNTVQSYSFIGGATTVALSAGVGYYFPNGISTRQPLPTQNEQMFPFSGTVCYLELGAQQASVNLGTGTNQYLFVLTNQPGSAPVLVSQTAFLTNTGGANNAADTYLTGSFFDVTQGEMFIILVSNNVATIPTCSLNWGLGGYGTNALLH